MQSTQDKPALLGGEPVRKEPLELIHNIGEEEIEAAVRVLRRGPLSGFHGTWGEKFFGGPEVVQFEKLFAERFKVKHAVSFNTATTALHGAMVALEIGPGDEVIVAPYSMACSATCVINSGGIPVFADIDERTFNMDPASIRSKISKYTKAIVVVNLYGQAAALDEIMAIAREHNLKVVEDNAQSPGATYKGKYAGTIADIGIWSFNVNKVMQAGEGGVLTTNDDRYALRAQLCRNHGESVIDDIPGYEGPMFGSNYRMTELEAAIASEQLKKLDFFTEKKRELISYVELQLKDIPGIITPHVPSENTHVYFQYAIKIDEATFGMSRDLFVKAMVAEGFPIGRGYVKPIYWLKVFQERRAFNNTHFPFEYPGYEGKPDYSKGSCPVVERMYDKELIAIFLFWYPRDRAFADSFISAVRKVLAHKDELKALT